MDNYLTLNVKNAYYCLTNFTDSFLFLCLLYYFILYIVDYNT